MKSHGLIPRARVLLPAPPEIFPFMIRTLLTSNALMTTVLPSSVGIMILWPSKFKVTSWAVVWISMMGVALEAGLKSSLRK